MQQITSEDLNLIKSLSARTYTGLTLMSNSSENERGHLTAIKLKLKQLARYFANKYNTAYGPFETAVSSGNPMTRGNTFNNVWAGLFKGASNKQYAAQISFVMNKQNACLDVGFYFGRASGHNLEKEQKTEQETKLNNLGISLSNAILNNPAIRARYSTLFDFGFTAYSNGTDVLSTEWYNLIRTSSKNTQIIAKIFPNDFGIIENSTIDSYVSQVIFLMAAINDPNVTPKSLEIKPLTPEQRAKQAERLAQIGLQGEILVLNKEIEKLSRLRLLKPGYPKHVALESSHYGFDVLSLDNNGDEIFIEVKTTTRKKEDINSRRFFISNNELDIFTMNKHKYRLHRVYDIENTPSVEELDLNTLTKKPDGYIIEY